MKDWGLNLTIRRRRREVSMVVRVAPFHLSEMESRRNLWNQWWLRSQRRPDLCLSKMRVNLWKKGWLFKIYLTQNLRKLKRTAKLPTTTSHTRLAALGINEWIVSVSRTSFWTSHLKKNFTTHYKVQVFKDLMAVRWRNQSRVPRRFLPVVHLRQPVWKQRKPNNNLQRSLEDIQ